VIGIVGRNAALQVAPAVLAAGIDGILCYPPPLALAALEGEMSALSCLRFLAANVAIFLECNIQPQRILTKKNINFASI
jgi:hypothetical protein